MATAPKPKPNKDLPTKAGMNAIQKKLTKLKAAAKPSTVQQVAKRFGITAREARDIATAVTTLGKAVVTPGKNYGSLAKNKPATIVKAAGDIAKQAGETYTAATKGKAGTAALKLTTKRRGASGMPSDVEYKTGGKRKQGSKK